MRKKTYMTENTSTPFSNRCEILGDLWIGYKNDPEFLDFIDYNDLGLPLAYALATEIVAVTPKAEMFVNETFELLLASLNLTDDGFDSLDDLLGFGETE
jgi:hypothetical protein